MGAGHQFEIDAMREKKKAIHPAWVAVGCFTLVGLTTAGYLLAGWFIAANSVNGWIPLPRELAGPPQSPYLLIRLALALIVLLFGSAVFSIVYTLINPPKPGKYDVIDPSIFPPPPKRMR
jgi:phage shock protein PspC (stress-responsive transcriptional regulator)